jgi:hypothetical protein
MKRYVLVLAAAFSASFVALGGNAGAQQAGTIAITGPANGATVSGPVRLSVNIQGVPVKPAADGDPAAYHYHALVDVDPSTVVIPGQPIPTGQANIIHTADPTIEIPDLAPGQHTIVVILTRTDHVPLSPSVQDRVTFTVGAGAQAGQAPAAGAGTGQTPIAAPRTGTGGLLGADAEPSFALLGALAALLALAAGATALRRRRAPVVVDRRFHHRE